MSDTCSPFPQFGDPGLAVCNPLSRKKASKERRQEISLVD